MHDPVPVLAEVEEADAGRLSLPAQPGAQALARRETVADAVRRAGHGVVGGGEGKLRVADSQAALQHVRERPAARQVMQQVAVHMQQRPAIAEVGDHVGVPDLVEHRPCGHRLPPYRAADPAWRNGIDAIRLFHKLDSFRPD